MVWEVRSLSSGNNLGFVIYGSGSMVSGSGLMVERVRQGSIEGFGPSRPSCRSCAPCARRARSASVVRVEDLGFRVKGLAFGVQG